MEETVFSEGIDDDALDLFGDTCARLTVRFADRAAVLWRAGFDDETWAAFEARCLVALAGEGDGGGARRDRFARAFERCRHALTDPACPSTGARSDAVPTLTWTGDLPDADTNPVEPAPEPSAPPPTPEPSRERLALLDAMTTLASPTSSTPSGRKP